MTDEKDADAQLAIAGRLSKLDPRLAVWQTALGHFKPLPLAVLFCLCHLEKTRGGYFHVSASQLGKAFQVKRQSAKKALFALMNAGILERKIVDGEVTQRYAINHGWMPSGEIASDEPSDIDALFSDTLQFAPATGEVDDFEPASETTEPVEEDVAAGLARALGVTYDE